MSTAITVSLQTVCTLTVDIMADIHKVLNAFRNNFQTYKH